MLELTDQSIESRGGPAAPDPAAGAVVVFEGRVRAESGGRAVLRLEYEAADGPARAEFARIEEESKKRFGVLSVECVHRTGIVELGELAVRITVRSAHRGEAFDACRYVIDELKHRLPVWKKEHYADGPAQWINAP